MKRIFVVDDDVGICRAVERALIQAGFEVRYGHDGASLYRAAVEWEPDLVVLDVRLGREDGRDVARSFRAMHDTPILMLTGQAAVDDRISGLESGADDYLCKPFDNGELVARVRALVRRYVKARDPEDSSEKPISLDREHRVLSSPSRGTRESLTEVQTNILAVLLERVGHVVSREELYSLVFLRPWVPSDRSLDVHVSNLRKALNRIEPERVEIQSIRHVGYRLLLDAGEAPASS